ELDDNQTMTCTGSGIWSPGYPSCTLSAEGECVEEGGTWDPYDGGSCKAEPEPEPEGECENEGRTWYVSVYWGHAWCE
ncbi:MAG: hypothetical protein ABGY10_02720, partial [bacterium]